MQPSVSKFRAASDIDCSDHDKQSISLSLFQTWLVGFSNWLVNEVRIGLTSADEFKGKKEVSDFTPEQKKEALMKEYNNLESTGTIELVPSDQVKDIPLSKQITSHSFPIVKDDNTLKYRTVDIILHAHTYSYILVRIPTYMLSVTRKSVSGAR